MGVLKGMWPPHPAGLLYFRVSVRARARARPLPALPHAVIQALPHAVTVRPLRALPHAVTVSGQEFVVLVQAEWAGAHRIC